MTLTLKLPQDLERRLSAEAEQMGLALPEYALRLLADRQAAPKKSLPRTGADLVDFWKAEGLIGARPEITDAVGHARALRERAGRRPRA